MPNVIFLAGRAILSVCKSFRELLSSSWPARRPPPSAAPEAPEGCFRCLCAAAALLRVVKEDGGGVTRRGGVGNLALLWPRPRRRAVRAVPPESGVVEASGTWLFSPRPRGRAVRAVPPRTPWLRRASRSPLAPCIFKTLCGAPCRVFACAFAFAYKGAPLTERRRRLLRPERSS